jgi:hypothetical protein
MSAGNTFEVAVTCRYFWPRIRIFSSKSTYTVVYNILTVLNTLDWSYLHTYKKTTYTDRGNKNENTYTAVEQPANVTPIQGDRGIYKDIVHVC